MASVNRIDIAENISKKLDGHCGPFLPWAQEVNGQRRVAADEWEEYCQRQRRHEQGNPGYVNGFGRPTPASADAAWTLLEPFLSTDATLDSLLPGYTQEEWFSVEEKDRLRATTKQAFLIVLQSFMEAGENHRIVTRNTMFDVLAARFSDNFRSTPVDTVWDMTEETVKRCRRDLLLNGIKIKSLWELVVDKGSYKRGRNPLFLLKRLERGGRQVFPRDNSSTLKAFQAIIHRDPHCGKLEHGWFGVLFGDQELPTREDVRQVCADGVRYNEVVLGERSKRILELQENARLLFDVGRFLKDYKSAKRQEKDLRRKIQKKSDIDARLYNAPRWIPDDVDKFQGGDQVKRRRVFEPAEGEDVKMRVDRQIWSPRDKEVYFRSMEEGLKRQWGRDDPELEERCRKILEKVEAKEKWELRPQGYAKWYEERHGASRADTPQDLIRAAQAGKAHEWRAEVHELLAQFDRVYTLTVQYRRVDQQIRKKFSKARTGHIAIRTGFYRVVNRRYQPTHLWPTFVSARGTRPHEPSHEAKTTWEAYRKRWFKVEGPDGKPCNLVGYDISSSQTQILAIFLGLNELQDRMVTEGQSMKQILAKSASAKHESGELPFSRGRYQYDGPEDHRLQEFVKTLWMRVLYGSPVREVIWDIHKDPATFGPGWGTESATAFLKSQEPYYDKLREFLELGRKLAKVAKKRDPYDGLQLQDPFDGATVRWNPVKRLARYVASEGWRVTVSVPGTTVEEADKTVFKRATPMNGHYPVDFRLLRNMVAPCLIHMMDAHFSSLVMETLASRGIRDFVGIHDCWLVPEKVRIGGTVEDGRRVLREAIDQAGREWYEGLGTVFHALSSILGGRSKLGKRVKELKKRWEERKSEGYTPKFLIRES